MKKLAEYIISEGILDSTHSGKNIIFTEKYVSKYIADIFWEVFGDVIDKDVNEFIGFHLNLKGEEIDTTDKKTKNTSLKHNRQKWAKILFPKIQEFEKKLSSIYDLKNVKKIKTPQQKSYVELHFYIDNKIEGLNFCHVYIDCRSAYDDDKKKEYNYIDIGSGELPSLDKYLKR